jgi:hypothetical protein
VSRVTLFWVAFILTRPLAVASAIPRAVSRIPDATAAIVPYDVQSQIEALPALLQPRGMRLPWARFHPMWAR